VELFLAATLLFLESHLLLRALRQRAALSCLAPYETSPGADAAAVEVIVPARNEAPNIRECLEGLVVQTYPSGKLSITVVDDNSEDGTDEIIAAFARSHPSVRCLRSGPLQPGWTGKTQACWRGAAEASPDAEWLAFIDADMRAEPSLIASAVAEAERAPGLLSLAPKHRLVSFAERLMIPCGLYLLGFQQDLANIRNRGGCEVNVAGQFMLIRRSAYQQVGGHAAVGAAICEDLELAKLMNRSGFSIALMDGSGLLSTRMYSGWTTLWPGFAKNVLEMFGGVGSTLTTAAFAVVVSWSLVILPAVDCFRAGGAPLEGWIAFGLAIATAAAAVGFHVAGSAHFRIPLWYGLLFPVAYTLGGVIALDGLRRRLTGRVPWKGRVYP
jgi:chlorobactene glucosyltransferase